VGGGDVGIGKEARPPVNDTRELHGSVLEGRVRNRVPEVSGRKNFSTVEAPGPAKRLTNCGLEKGKTQPNKS